MVALANRRTGQPGSTQRPAGSASPRDHPVGRLLAALSLLRRRQRAAPHLTVVPAGMSLESNHAPRSVRCSSDGPNLLHSAVSTPSRLCWLRSAGNYGPRAGALQASSRHGAAMESNHPSGGLLRPAGFEDLVGMRLVQGECVKLNGFHRSGPSRLLEGRTWCQVPRQWCSTTVRREAAQAGNSPPGRSIRCGVEFTFRQGG